jgi:hypothetical protein
MFFRTVFAGVLLAGFSHGALAEIGPCKPDKSETMVCGSGIGAARTIPELISPDKKFAFAWRNPKSAPDTEPDEPRDNELLLIRLADGAVLARTQTEYWFTGEARANRQHETSLWSNNSRMVARVWDTRFETSGFTMWAVTADGKLAGEVDLRKIVEPAVRGELKKVVRDTRDYAFTVYTDQEFTLKDNGRLGFHATMTIPKKEGGEEFYVDMKATVVNGKLTARVLKVEHLKN